MMSKLKKNQIPRALAASTVLIIFFAIYRFVLAGTFNWKEFESSSLGVTFKYPSSWRKCEINDNIFRIVAVIDGYREPTLVSTQSNGGYTAKLFEPTTCDNFLTTGRSYLKLSLIEPTAETDIRTWITQAGQDEVVEGELPMVGGENWIFVKYEESLIPGLSRTAAAEVIGLGDMPKYLFIQDGKVFELEYAAESGAETIPLKLILRSISF